MYAADDFHDLGHGLFEWSAYDPAVKVDLHAHALAVDRELVCFDPVDLRREAREELFAAAGASGFALILLTNGNHARASEKFRRQFDAPVCAHEGARAALRADGLVVGVDEPPRGLKTLVLPGFGPGEVAYLSPADGGTLFVGDALINLPAPHGFDILPEKYCEDPKVARGSLRTLLDVPFERILFAHGTPLVTGAQAKLESLLATVKA